MYQSSSRRTQQNYDILIITTISDDKFGNKIYKGRKYTKINKEDNSNPIIPSSTDGSKEITLKKHIFFPKLGDGSYVISSITHSDIMGKFNTTVSESGKLITITPIDSTSKFDTWIKEFNYVYDESKGIYVTVDDSTRYLETEINFSTPGKYNGIIRNSNFNMRINITAINNNTMLYASIGGAIFTFINMCNMRILYVF